MKRRIRRAALCLTLALSASAASGDELAGLWAYRSLHKPAEERAPLVGIFLFHDGRFVHHAMHGGEPLDEQLTDAHVGTYRIRSDDVMQIDVTTGVVVTPAGETLLAGRSDTRHEVVYDRTGDRLRLRYANGSSEELERIDNDAVTFVRLDHGMLALTDRHFVLVTNPGNRWIAGSGGYQRDGERLRLQALRWFEVDGKAVEYRADETIEAGYDGQVLTLPDGTGFEILE